MPEVTVIFSACGHSIEVGDEIIESARVKCTGYCPQCLNELATAEKTARARQSDHKDEMDAPQRERARRRRPKTPLANFTIVLRLFGRRLEADP